jgi:transcriptional regulator with XRE-family HTH domain
MSKSIKDQFYSLLREAMFANQLTASDLSQRKGVHYTYVYNSIRKTANLTFKSAQDLAAAAGYAVKLVFEPLGGQPELTGSMDPEGKLFTARRAPAVQAVQADLFKPTSLDDEIESLLAGA